MNKQSFTSLLAHRHISFFLFMLFLFIFPKLIFAQVDQSFFRNYLTNFTGLYADKSGFVTNVQPYAFVVNAISFLLVFLGVLFVSLLVYGGYLWMLARGNEEQLTKAKGILTDAITGIIIVLASYMITYYLVKLAFTITQVPGDPTYIFQTPTP